MLSCVPMSATIQTDLTAPGPDPDAAVVAGALGVAGDHGAAGTPRAAGGPGGTEVAGIAGVAGTPSAAGAGVAVTLQGLGRRFGGRAVVADLDLQIPAGQFLALLGPSGCGKTTLLRLIAGLDTPDQGVIQLEGDREGQSRAYVFQEACLLPWRQVLDNVALPLELSGVPKAERRARARELIRLVGLEEASARYPDELSGGMKMRVSLARALITRPRLLLLDEPFAALDDFTRQYLDDHLQGLFLAHGMTVVFVTHSMAEAVYLADRVVMLAPQGGGVVLDQAVDLPRPRDQDTRVSPGYAAHIHCLATALARWATNGRAPT